MAYVSQSVQVSVVTSNIATGGVVQVVGNGPPKIQGKDELKCGFMSKCGKSTKSWKRRWFVLSNGGILYYYENARSGAEKGRVDVTRAKQVDMHNNVYTAEKLNSREEGTRSFAIESPERTYTFICDSEEECRNWLQVLGTFCRSSKVQSPVKLTQQQAYPGPPPVHQVPPTYNYPQAVPMSPPPPQGGYPLPPSPSYPPPVQQQSAHYGTTGMGAAYHQSYAYHQQSTLPPPNQYLQGPPAPPLQPAVSPPLPAYTHYSASAPPPPHGPPYPPGPPMLQQTNVNVYNGMMY